MASDEETIFDYPLISVSVNLANSILTNLDAENSNFALGNFDNCMVVDGSTF